MDRKGSLQVWEVYVLVYRCHQHLPTSVQMPTLMESSDKVVDSQLDDSRWTALPSGHRPRRLPVVCTVVSPECNECTNGLPYNCLL